MAARKARNINLIICVAAMIVLFGMFLCVLSCI